MSRTDKLIREIATLCELDAVLMRSAAISPYRLYEALHESAAQLLAVDSFYVCLFEPKEQRLFYPYNFDDGVYDGPVNLPLGQGPTSWVIRNGKPFRLTPENWRIHTGGTRFGDMSRISLSAIHVPMFGPAAVACASSESVPVFGVVSALSYEPGVYDEASEHILGWLASRAGALMFGAQREKSWQERLRAAESQAAERWNAMLRMTDDFVAVLQEIAAEAENVRKLADPQQRPAVLRLLQSCYRAQTEASQVPLQQAWKHAAPSVSESAAVATKGSGPNDGGRNSGASALTSREREVLDLMALGRTNAQIADELCVSKDAVKFHCRNIFQKLNISSRRQAVSIVASLKSAL